MSGDTLRGDMNMIPQVNEEQLKIGKIRDQIIQLLLDSDLTWNNIKWILTRAKEDIKYQAIIKSKSHE